MRLKYLAVYGKKLITEVQLGNTLVNKFFHVNS